MVARILEGASPAEMPVETLDNLELYVNPAAAEKMGTTLSDDIISEASKVVGND